MTFLLSFLHWSCYYSPSFSSLVKPLILLLTLHLSCHYPHSFSSLVILLPLFLFFNFRVIISTPSLHWSYYYHFFFSQHGMSLSLFLLFPGHVILLSPLFYCHVNSQIKANIDSMFQYFLDNFFKKKFNKIDTWQCKTVSMHYLHWNIHQYLTTFKNLLEYYDILVYLVI